MAERALDAEYIKPSKLGQEELRGYIRARELIERLNSHALQKPLPGNEKPEKMTAGEISAAKILLDRILPTLSAVEATEPRRMQPTEAQLIDRISRLIAENPALLDMVRSAVPPAAAVRAPSVSVPTPSVRGPGGLTVSLVRPHMPPVRKQ